SLHVRQYMIDRTHSNSYQTWVSQGKPAAPSQAQWVSLRDTGELCSYSATQTATGGTWTVRYPQNVYGGSLFVLSPERRGGRGSGSRRSRLLLRYAARNCRSDHGARRELCEIVRRRASAPRGDNRYARGVTGVGQTAEPIAPLGCHFAVGFHSILAHTTFVLLSAASCRRAPIPDVGRQRPAPSATVSAPVHVAPPLYSDEEARALIKRAPSVVPAW